MISEHGPHGPVGPIAQKLSFSSNRTICEAGSPIVLCQRSYASSSSRKTDTVIRFPSRPTSRVRKSHPKKIASFLK
jgi:hypothetical protein